MVFDYIDGAADDELTMRRNESAFTRVTFCQKTGLGKIVPSLRTSVLGRAVDLPVLLAPCGLVRLMHADGAVGVARAAASRGSVSILSTVAGTPVETVAAESGTPIWFQLYAAGGLLEADALCDRAAAAGAEALVVTVDTPATGNRERDVRHGVAPPLRIDAHNAAPLGAQVLMRPRWAAQLAATGVRLSRRDAIPFGNGSGVPSSLASPFSWDDVAHLRKRWSGPLVVKGILLGEDARRAVDAGASGVVVSNHGGRQLDGALAPAHAIEEVAAAVDGRGPVLLDGGVRDGRSVLKALCLGADAVMVGRPAIWALAAGGEEGVFELLEGLRLELAEAMALAGARRLSECDRSLVRFDPAKGGRP